MKSAHSTTSSGASCARFALAALLVCGCSSSALLDDDASGPDAARPDAVVLDAGSDLARDARVPDASPDAADSMDASPMCMGGEPTDCPASTCGASTCGVSSCGRWCGSCLPTEGCFMGTCVPSSSCPGSSRCFGGDQGHWTCEGTQSYARCAADEGRARCICDGTGLFVACEECVTPPVACDGVCCPEGGRCDAWTGRCEPGDADFPPAGADNGGPCTSDVECRSHGSIGEAFVSACRVGSGADWPGGYCTSYCNVPPEGFWPAGQLPRSNCPEGSLCLPDGTGAPAPNFGVCVRGCNDDADCRVDDGYYCRRSFESGDYEIGYCAPAHCTSRGCPRSIECFC